MPKVNTFPKPLIKEFWKKMVASLNARLTVAEENIQIIIEGGTPKLRYACGSISEGAVSREAD